MVGTQIQLEACMHANAQNNSAYTAHVAASAAGNIAFSISIRKRQGRQRRGGGALQGLPWPLVSIALRLVIRTNA